MSARSLMRSLYAAMAVLIATWAEQARSASQPVWPDHLNLLDVKSFGAKGDGITDDTVAITMAIAAAENQRPVPIYFPEGVYRISDTLKRTDKEGHPTNALNLLGASREKTTLLLADSTPGFGDAAAPKAMILTASHLWQTGATEGGKDWIGKGEGNQAFQNYVTDMTIDVGTGNPGAIGIDYLANNVGSLRNLRIVDRGGAGRAGIAMTRKWPGPALLSNVEIDGFDTGLAIAQLEYGITIDGLRLLHQRRVGLSNRSNSLAIRKLSITGAPLPVENLGAEALMVLVGGNFDAGTRHDSAQPPFVNEGRLHLRDVHLSGFRPVAGGTERGVIKGHFQADTRLGGCDLPLPLPLQDIPAVTPASGTAWVSIRAFGAIPNDGRDDTDAINRALASGAADIVFPYGRYDVSGPLRIPSRVRRVLGLHSELRMGAMRGDGPLIEVRGEGDPLTLESLSITNNDSRDPGSRLIAHEGRREVIVRDIWSPLSESIMVDRRDGGGELLLENICCGRLTAAGKQPIFARQFDTEGAATRIVLDGTPLSILGLKTEFAATIIDGRNGADVEVLGGLLYPVRPVPASLPAFRIEDGRMLLSYAESGYHHGMNYAVHIEAQTNQSSLRVMAERFPPRTMGRVVDCFDTSEER